MPRKPRKPKKKITDAFIRNVSVPKKSDRPNQVHYVDTKQRGLALVLSVGHAGTKSFRGLRYVNGKARWITFGRYPEMSLADATKALWAWWEAPERFEEKQETGTFAEVAEEFLKRHVAKKQLISAREVERHFRVYILPALKDRPFRDVRRREIAKLLDQIEEKNGAGMADAILKSVRKCQRWYATVSDDYQPVVVNGMERNHAPSRSRVLTDDELRALWSVTGGETDVVFNMMARVALLTGQRKSKVRKMRWSDLVETEHGLAWRVKRAAREKGVPELVPLSRLAIDAVMRLEPLRFAEDGFVFVGANGVAFARFSAAMDRLRARLPASARDVRFHDLRRSCRSLLSRAGIAPHIGERVLGHVIRGVQGTYDRYPYVPEIKAALAKLADLVERIVDPRPVDNVVPFRG